MFVRVCVCVYVLVYFFRLNNSLKNNFSLLNILWLALDDGGRGGRLNDTADGWGSGSVFSITCTFFTRYTPSFVFLLRLRNSSRTLLCVCSEIGLDRSWDNTVDEFFNIDGRGGRGGGGRGGWEGKDCVVDERSWSFNDTGGFSIDGRTGWLVTSFDDKW